MTSRSALLVTPRWTRDGGVAAHVQVSAEALAAHGLTVAVAAARIDEGPAPEGVTLHHSPALMTSGAPLQERLGEATDAGAFDVVHVHQIDDDTLVDAVRPFAPVAISAHGYTACTSGVYYFEPGHECTRGHGVGCWPNLIARGCAHTSFRKTLPRKYLNTTHGRDALARADIAISYSTAVDRHLANNGVERRTIVPYFPTMAPRPGSGHEGRRRVVFAGRVVRPKGVPVLIQAARELDAEFVVCGDGRELEPMRALAGELGVAERVRFTGWLGPDDLAAELGEASIVAVPSLWPEPFCLVGIEGFAAGRPAVASATGGIPDWCTDGVSGLLVAPGDPAALARALGELLDDPQRQEQMGAAGMADAAARFSPASHVQALLAAYERARASWSQGAPARA